MEKAVLSSMLQGGGSAIGRARVLPPEAFCNPINRKVFVHLVTAHQGGIPTDLISFTQSLRDKGILDKIGGASYLTELQTFVAADGFLDHYIEVVSEKHTQREIVKLGQRITGETTAAEIRARLDAIEPNGSDGGLPEKLQQLSAVSMMPIRFVDKPLFQADAFHLLVGKKNAGKGTFLSAIAARVTRGQWGENRNVIWIAAGEDSLALDVRPRIEAASGDVSRVYYPPFVPKLPTEVALLQKWAEELGHVGLIVMDPVSGMVPGLSNSNLDSDVRRAISPLNDLADNLKCVVVGVRHLKKNAAAGALDSVLGSVDWINVPRAVLAIVREPDGEIRYAQVVAGNRVPCGSDSTGFRIVGADIVSGGEPVAKAEFIDGPGRDVDDLLSVDQEDKPMSRTKRAVVRMLDLLDQSGAEGMKQDALFAQVARELDMSALTVRNKAFFGILHDLGLVKSHKDGMHGGWTIKRSSLPRPPEYCSNNNEE
jgi:Replicative DNA helicase